MSRKGDYPSRLSSQVVLQAAAFQFVAPFFFGGGQHVSLVAYHFFLQVTNQNSAFGTILSDFYAHFHFLFFFLKLEFTFYSRDPITFFFFF